MKRVDEAFETVDRRDFLPAAVRLLWRQDSALPIGYGQTNSQPSTVRRMLEWLDVQPDTRVLDVGSGSGWTSALLATLVGPRGRIDAVEIVPQLVSRGRANCSRVGIDNVEFHQAGEVIGLPERAPFDRILVSAAADKFPDELIEQLAAPGKLVVPVGEAIIEICKDAAGAITQRQHNGYRFVPLIDKR